MKWRDWRFANRHRGEVAARINGRRRILRLSLSALARLEDCYAAADDAAGGVADILHLLSRFAENGMQAEDVDNVLRAGLQAVGDVLAVTGEPLDVDGGPEAAAQIALQLIARAFAPPSDCT